MVFRIVSATPAGQVRVQTRAAGDISKSDLVIGIHALLEGEPVEGMTVPLLPLSTERSLSLWSPDGHLQHEEFRDNLKGWKALPSLRYGLEVEDLDSTSLLDKCLRSALVQELVQHGAFGEHPKALPMLQDEAADKLAMLHHLEAEGLVICVNETDVSSLWALTQTGLAKTTVEYVLAEPGYPLRRRSVPLQEQTTYELMDFMWENMVDQTIIPRGRGLQLRLASLAPFDGKEPSSWTWYCIHDQPAASHEYLLALAIAVQQHLDGNDDHMFPIDHFKKVAYYAAATKALLNGEALALEDLDYDHEEGFDAAARGGRKRKRPAVPALCDDVDVPPAAPLALADASDPEAGDSDHG